MKYGNFIEVYNNDAYKTCMWLQAYLFEMVRKFSHMPAKNA